MNRRSWLPFESAPDPLGAYQAKRAFALTFELHGHKLHGRWILVRMKGKGEKQPAWLLIKGKDAYAQASAACSVVDELPDSVKALGPARSGASADDGGHRSAADHDLPAEAVPSALPSSLAPQLATLVAVPPSDAGAWLFEIKFDGYRMLVRNDAPGVRLLTRNGHDWTARLRPLQSTFEGLNLPPGW